MSNTGAVPVLTAILAALGVTIAVAADRQGYTQGYASEANTTVAPPKQPCRCVCRRQHQLAQNAQTR